MAQFFWTHHADGYLVVSLADSAAEAALTRAEDANWLPGMTPRSIVVCVWTGSIDDRRDRTYWRVTLDATDGNRNTAEQVDAPDLGTEVVTDA